MRIPTRPEVLIDALNVAYWCGSPPSLRLPMALMNHLLTHASPAFLYFDASARYKFESESAAYARLLQYPEFVIQVPSGQPADRAMLRRATTSGGCIVSRDHYRDYRKRYRKLIDNPARLISGQVENDHLLLPSLAVSAALPASTEAAWAELEGVLNGFKT